jgi:hypothetical protein
MKKKIVRFLATSLSVAMVAINPLTVFALNPDDDPHVQNPATTGNILAYAVDEYVVPTSIQIALNPQGFTVVTRPDDPLTGVNEETTSNAEIISLNYGVANLSTTPKTINLEIQVEAMGNEVDDLGDIQFVNDPTIITGHEANNIAAPEIYLAVQKNNIEVPVTIYNGQAGGEAFAVTVNQYTAADPEHGIEFNDGDNTHNVTPENLCDVVMTANVASAENFVRVSDTTAKCEVSFGPVAAATYNVHDHQQIDMDTTQAQLLADKMEITHVGGVQGFTITGIMNSVQDWRAANVDGINALSFVPIYECVDYVEDQFVRVDVDYIAVQNAYYIDIPEGDEVNNVKVNGVAVNEWSYANNYTQIRVNSAAVQTALGNMPGDLRFEYTAGDNENVVYFAEVHMN